MRDRTATRFGSCVTPLVLGAIQFCFTQVLPWTFVQHTNPHPASTPQHAAITATPDADAVHPSHKPHGVPQPVVKDILKAATKVPALTPDDAIEETLPAIADGFAVAE